MLAPLPLKRNPNSHVPGYSEADISVQRINDPSTPVPYRLTSKPETREEFLLDVPRALLRFGSSQAAGDRLEVTHWTMAFAEDIVSVRYSGSAALDVWGKDFADVLSIARIVQQKLGASRETLRSQGFAILNPAGLNPAVSILQQSGTGSAFPVCRQTLNYRFAFEKDLGGETSEGIAIRRIDVHANDEVNEKFTLPPQR